MKPEQFKLVREFREPALPSASPRFATRERTPFIALMREGRVSWQPVRVLWQDTLMAAVEFDGSATMRQTDMVLLEVHDGSPLAQLDEGDRVVLSEN